MRVRRGRRGVSRVRGCRSPPHSHSFRASKRGMKNCWKFWQRVLTPPTPSSSRLHLIKGAWSSSGLRKNFSAPTHTRTHVYTHSCSALTTRHGNKLHYAARGYRPVSVSLAGARTRVVHRIIRRWRSPYFTRYRSRRVLIYTSWNLSTFLPGFLFIYLPRIR